MNPVTDEKRTGALWGTFIGDALAMPVHWYYDRAALKRDYGTVSDYLAPRNPHPDSILWRSAYTSLNERGDILHEQAQYWEQRGIHYRPHPGGRARRRRMARSDLPAWQRLAFGAHRPAVVA